MNNKINPVVYIAVAFALISTIWIYAADNHFAEISNITKNSEDIKDRKAYQQEVDSSGKTYTHKRMSTVRLRSTNSYYIDNLQHAVYSEDEDAIENAAEDIADCNDCIDQLIDILNNPSYDDDFRKHAALALLESGTREGVLAIIDFITTTEQKERDTWDPMKLFAETDSFENDQHQQDDLQMKEVLMRMLEEGNSLDTDQQLNLYLRAEFISMFSEVDSFGNVPVLVDVLTGKDETLNNGMIMSNKLRQAIYKAIRNVSDHEAVGELLAEQYKYESSPEVKNKLISIGHPGMDALLAAEAYKQGNDEEALMFTEQLKVLDDVRAIEGMMYLTRESDAPLEDIAEMLYQWTERYPDERNYDVFVQYLIDSSKTPEERAISAYALIAMNNTDKVINILERAYNSESDPLVLDYIELALYEINRKIEEGES